MRIARLLVKSAAVGTGLAAAGLAAWCGYLALDYERPIHYASLDSGSYQG